MVRDRVTIDQRRPINGELEEVRVRMCESQISRIPIRSRGVMTRPGTGRAYTKLPGTQDYETIETIFGYGRMVLPLYREGE